LLSLWATGTTFTRTQTQENFSEIWPYCSLFLISSHYHAKFGENLYIRSQATSGHACTHTHTHTHNAHPQGFVTSPGSCCYMTWSIRHRLIQCNTVTKLIEVKKLTTAPGIKLFKFTNQKYDLQQESVFTNLPTKPHHSSV
jgi:hypothetical protein